MLRLDALRAILTLFVTLRRGAAQGECPVYYEPAEPITVTPPQLMYPPRLPKQPPQPPLGGGGGDAAGRNGGGDAAAALLLQPSLLTGGDLLLAVEPSPPGGGDPYYRMQCEEVIPIHDIALHYTTLHYTQCEGVRERCFGVRAGDDGEVATRGSDEHKGCVRVRRAIATNHTDRRPRVAVCACRRAVVVAVARRCGSETWRRRALRATPSSSMSRMITRRAARTQTDDT